MSVAIHIAKGVTVMDSVFLIEFIDSKEQRDIDNMAYASEELAEEYLLEIDYEKKLDWREKWYFEHKKKPDNYATILKLGIKYKGESKDDFKATE